MLTTLARTHFNLHKVSAQEVLLLLLPMAVLTNLIINLGLATLFLVTLSTPVIGMNLTIVPKLQNVLGVQLITKDEIRSACEKYLDYTFDMVIEE
jgi:hypothetical protein